MNSDGPEVQENWKVRLLDSDDAVTEWVCRELQEGRLRFGWGWEGSDLREIAELRDRGEPLNEHQTLAWSKGSALVERIREGDLVFTPNIPRNREFAVVRVAGPYSFEPEGTSCARGHVLPVEVVVPAVQKLSEAVSGRIVGSAFNQRAITRMTAPGEDIRALLEAHAEGLDLSKPSSEMERLADIVGDAKEAVAAALEREFGRKGFEIPVRRLFEALYPPPSGSVEHSQKLDNAGADIVVQVIDPVGFEREIAVQVKHWTGGVTMRDMETALDAIRRAKSFRPVVSEGLVFTLLESVPQEVADASEALSDELGIAVRVLDRDAVAQLFLENLVELGSSES
jgi:hypothetical protein